jgi:hypothetical protein
MPNPTTCDVRSVTAPDGTLIPVPVGGLGLPDGTSVEIDSGAEVQVNVNYDGSGNVIGYYVVLNNSPGASSEADELFAELAQEVAIATLEQLARKAFTTVPTLVIKAVGLVAGVLATLLTSSTLTREVFIRCDLDTGMATDGPPVTYCLLLPG